MMKRNISWLMPGLVVLLQLMASPSRISAATAVVFCNGNDNTYNLGSASGLTTSQINGFRASGFTTMVLFTMSVATNGDFSYGGQTICTNGVYDGPSNWGLLLAQCEVAPSSVNRIEMCLGGAGDTSWTNIKSLIAADGTNATTVLYQNLSALKTVLGIDAIDSDDESAFDSASAINFGKMCGSVGLKMTLCPYDNSSYWSAVQSGLGTNCDAIYLQCYEGGAGNDPATWNSYFSGLKVIPGYWDNERSSIFLTNMVSWSNAGGPGGFLWPSCTGCNPPAGASEMLQYAGWIQTAFFRFQPAITPASGFNAIADYNFQAQPASTTFTLTNGTAGSFSWSLINTSSWLTVSSPSGTLAAGATTSVTASLNTAVATNLPQNTYAASLVFTNPTLGGTTVCAFTLNTAIINWPVALTGFNAAILASNNATAGAPGATAFDLPNNYCLYQQGLGGGPRGLPLSGVFSSQSDSSTAFQIGPYGTADSLMLGDTYPKSGTLTLPGPQAFNAIAILATSANGGGQGTFFLTFTNGFQSPVFAFNCQDWFNTVTNVAIRGFGRLKLGASLATEDDGSSNPNLYQTTVNLAALGLSLPVSSITFSNRAAAGSTETTAILGLSGMPASIQLQPPAGLAAIAGTNATVGLSWNAVVGATNYYIKRSTSGGTETTVASTTAVSYLDTGLVYGRTYYYVVSAVGVANESANSAEVSAAPGPAIALVDGPSSTVGASFQSNSASVSKSFTVSSNATVLVVVWTDKSTASGSQPSPLVWRVVGQPAENLTQAVTANSGSTVFRDNTIYYLYNPTPGAGTLTGTANVGVVANGTWLVAYTLNGVNTNAAPLTGSVNNNPGHASNGNGTSAVTNTVTGVPVNSWAVVSSSLSAGSSDTITLTNGGGTMTTTTDSADGSSGVTMGYVSGLSPGTDGFKAAGGA
ncbi:MAG TPA: hypothetical protein VNX46_04205, partial [Candidatus Acidoferrum sp.]|nr:hypothetical protein [Candidatus Acidoferrum sp.]